MIFSGWKIVSFNDSYKILEKWWC